METPLRQKRNPQISSSAGHHQKCVCQICTCGKHSCPPPSLPFQADTSYHDHYQPYALQPELFEHLNIKPKQGEYDPKVLKSTYEVSYTPHMIPRNQPFKPIQMASKAGRFQGQTEYNHRYQPNIIQRDQSFAPIQYTPNRGKFDSTTTYNRQFAAKQGQKPQSFGIESYIPKNVPFEGTTTYQRQYRPHHIQIEPKVKGDWGKISSRGRFEGESSYKQVLASKFRTIDSRKFAKSLDVQFSNCQLDLSDVLLESSICPTVQKKECGSDCLDLLRFQIQNST